MDRLLEDLISRRALIRAAGGAVLAAPAQTTGRVYRLGLLAPTAAPSPAERRAARALGLSLSPSLLARTDRIIE